MDTGPTAPTGRESDGVSKRLVVCCDGTWNTAGQENNGVPCPTNVVKLHRVVAPQAADGTRQETYYAAGVGTNWWDRVIGGAFGVGLSRNVKAAYSWLSEHYEPGDEIFLFGFSRGAFTVRSLAGLIRNSGILRPEEIARVGEAYQLYRSEEGPDAPSAQTFREQYARVTRVRFVGVWDTVGELGVPVIGPAWLKPLGHLLNRPWAFHDTQLSSRVDGAFQALAIDEQRSVFEPTLWHQQPDADGQVLEQVWFAGVHCSVGGGLVDTSLSDLALVWMAARAQEFGLEFRDSVFDLDPPTEHEYFTLRPDPVAAFADSRTRFYRLTKAFHRPIGQARRERSGALDGNETISVSAFTRYRDDGKYRPLRLVEYYERAGLGPGEG